MASNIVRLADRQKKCPDTINTLSSYLALAKQGKIDGAIVLVRKRDGDFSYSCGGTAKTKLRGFLGILLEVWGDLSGLSERIRG